MNKEFTHKFFEAKRLEKEAFMMLFPENMREHLEVIQKEVKTMLTECVMDAVLNQTKGQTKAETENNVKKIDIM